KRGSARSISSSGSASHPRGTTNGWSCSRGNISSSVPCTVGSTKTPGSAGLRRGSFLLPGRMGNQRWCLAWPTMDVPKTERKARMSIYWPTARSEEHTSELQSRENIVCRLLLEKKNKNHIYLVNV